MYAEGFKASLCIIYWKTHLDDYFLFLVGGIIKILPT